MATLVFRGTNQPSGNQGGRNQVWRGWCWRLLLEAFVFTPQNSGARIDGDMAIPGEQG
jgi:hypothetical protein